MNDNKNSAAVSVAVPAGWQLVPEVSTREMIDAAQALDMEGEDDLLAIWAAVYRAMLAAAPAAPVSADVRDVALEEAATIADATYIKDPFRFELGITAAKAIRALKSQPAPVTQQAAPTDMSKHLRAMAASPFESTPNEINNALKSAADEIDRLSQPPAALLSDDAVTAAARALCKHSADACGVNSEDDWKFYSEDYKAEARIALDAAILAKAAP